MNYCPKHDPYELLSKAGFIPINGRGMVKDISDDKRLHALMNGGVIEMHMDTYEPFKRRGLKREHKSSKNTHQVNNIIQKLKKIDNLRFFNIYNEN